MTPEKLPNHEGEFRIYFSPLTQGDLEYVRLLRNRFKEAFVYQKDITKEQQEEWFKKYSQQERKDYTIFVLKLKEDNQSIGMTSFLKVGDTFELGNNIIDTPFQGRGYFSEVYRLMKKEVGNEKIFATILPGNEHMIKVYEKLGFKHQGQKESLIYMTDY